MIADDVLLLLLDDAGEPLSVHIDTAVGAALLCDLTSAGRLNRPDDRDRLTVADPSPVGEPILDDALEAVAEKAAAGPVKSLMALDAVDRGAAERVAGRLVGAGVLTEETTKGLLRSKTRHPLADRSAKDDLIRRLLPAVQGSADPADSADSAVLSIVASAGALWPAFADRFPASERKTIENRGLALAKNPAAESVDTTLSAMSTVLATSMFTTVMVTSDPS